MACRLLLLCLILVSAPTGAQPLIDVRKDLAFGVEAVESVSARSYARRLQQLADKDLLDRDAVLLVRLQDILARLRTAAAYELPESAAIRWQLHTCRRCHENAAAMAGGRLLFSEEFIAQLGLSDAELGYLVAHEMVHVLAEHTREYATTARFFVDNGLHREYWDIQRELDESFVVNLRMSHEFERQELDADYYGFILGARAGFNPGAMLSLLRKLGGDEPSMLSRHPGEQRRMQQARTMLESARRIYARGLAPRD